MRIRIVAVIAVLSLCATMRAALSPSDVQKLPHAKIEAALPDEHPSAYYGYAARLFHEGKKDDAVFWFYVGQLRYRFHLKANPSLDPGGDPALFGSLSATVGETINGYAGGDVKGWVKAMDRALKWDADTANGFTSKKQFAAIYQENRAGLKKMRDQVAGQADAIREQRKKAGLENRK
jgi:hypothetical protein